MSDHISLHSLAIPLSRINQLGESTVQQLQLWELQVRQALSIFSISAGDSSGVGGGDHQKVMKGASRRSMHLHSPALLLQRQFLQLESGFDGAPSIARVGLCQCLKGRRRPSKAEYKSGHPDIDGGGGDGQAQQGGGIRPSSCRPSRGSAEQGAESFCPVRIWRRRNKSQSLRRLRRRRLRRESASSSLRLS